MATSDSGIRGILAMQAAAATQSTAGGNLRSSSETNVVDEKNVNPRVDAAVEARQKYGDCHHFTYT